jgi:hypothetical protein
MQAQKGSRSIVPLFSSISELDRGGGGGVNLRSVRFTPGNETLAVIFVEKIVAFLTLNILHIMYLFTKELPNQIAEHDILIVYT